MKPVNPDRYLRASAVCFLATVTACSTPTQRPTADVYVTKHFSAPLDTRLEVNTGDSVFVAGSYIEGEVIELHEGVDMKVPGSLGIPFPVHIDQGKLELTRIDGVGKYYCAQEGKASASFPGLGSVIANGDCVGIRISTDQTKKVWVVDNSIRNGMQTIWDKRMSTSDAARYQPETTSKPFKVQSLRRIIFDGYHGGQLHFTWEEITPDRRESKEFTFDFSGNDVLIGIKGNRFRALSADNVRLIYAWDSFEGGS